MNYVYVENNTVREIVPEYDPAFPGIPVEERYSEEFVSRLIADGVGNVRPGWIYDPGTGGFSPPPASEIVPEEELTDNSAENITKEDLLLAIAELAEKQEADKLETQEAIAELAESLM